MNSDSTPPSTMTWVFGEPILVYYDKNHHTICAYCHMRTFGFVYNGNKDGVNVSICWPCTQKK